MYEEGGATMPNVEKLAQKGVVFNNAFSNAPVCSVARSTIITGSYAPRIGAQYHRKMEPVPMPEGLEMFPTYLREAGYYTTNNSKQDYNLLLSAGTWDQSSNKASYKNRAVGQPIFHVQNFGATHEGQLHFDQEKMANTPTTSDLNAPLFPCYPDTELFRYTNAYYRDLHMKVDKQIGDFLNQLEEEGLMDNTIIFFYGDHGGVLPGSKGYLYERGLNVPMVVYVPEKWKHLNPFRSGTYSDVFIEFIDLGPTVLTLAGIEVPQEMDGKPFLGKGITEAELAKDNTVFGYADRFDEKYDLVRSLRKGDFKYIRSYQPFNIDGLFNFYRYKMLAYQEWQTLFDEGKLSDIESQFFLPKQAEGLYKISDDPHETKNLATDSAYAKVLTDLRAELQTRMKSMPDLSLYPESYFLQKGKDNPVLFGQINKANIGELLDIADLQLEDFSDAEPKIKAALNSIDPWKRYWGLIVCSYFKQEASEFFDLAKMISQNDPEGPNRMRAVEFLVLSNQKVDVPLIIDIVKNAGSETECNLMMNTVALLKSVRNDFEIQIPRSYFDPTWQDKANDLVNRRLEFINEE
jgi:arylsulfatase A-like enzyme